MLIIGKRAQCRLVPLVLIIILTFLSVILQTDTRLLTVTLDQAGNNSPLFNVTVRLIKFRAIKSVTAVHIFTRAVQLVYCLTSDAERNVRATISQQVGKSVLRGFFFGVRA